MELTFRRADASDAMDVLAWRNDPASVAASLSPGMVAVDAHLAWFAMAVADPARILMIAESGGARIGMVRFDRNSDGTWRVSINLDPRRREQGFGKPTLGGAIAAAFGTRQPELEAEIRDDNAASRSIFAACGFAAVGALAETARDGLGRYRRAARE